MTKPCGLYNFDFIIAHGMIAYLVREQDFFYEYVSPFTYMWMQKVQLPQWKECIETLKIEKDAVSLRPSTRKFTYEEWIFNYPIDASTLPHFQDITSFFEAFSLYVNESPTDKLERTIKTVEQRMPRDTLESLVTFVYHQHIKHPDRLHLLFSPLIAKYVKRGSE